MPVRRVIATVLFRPAGACIGSGEGYGPARRTCGGVQDAGCGVGSQWPSSLCGFAGTSNGSWMIQACFSPPAAVTAAFVSHGTICSQSHAIVHSYFMFFKLVCPHSVMIPRALENAARVTAASINRNHRGFGPHVPGPVSSSRGPCVVPSWHAFSIITTAPFPSNLKTKRLGVQETLGR